MTTLARLMVDVGVDEKGVSRGIEKTRAHFARMQKNADDDGNKVGTRFATALTNSLRKTLTPSVTAIATGLSAQITGAMAAGLVSGVTKMVHGIGAALALLPSIAATAGIAVGTVALALKGMGDALKAGLEGDLEKFNEAMAKLAPSAQSVVREILGAKGAFDRLRLTVQGNFFAPLVGAVSALAALYLPMLTGVLGGVASALGRAAAGVVAFLTTPSVFARITTAVGQMGQAIANIAAGIPNLVRAFLPLVTVGASFLPGLTGGFEAATARLARFMEQAERTGRLRTFIQGGIDALRSLWETTKQVGRILGNIGEIGRIVFEKIGMPAGTLLDTIERLTEKAAAFFRTGEGDSALSKALDLAGRFADSFFGSMQKIGEMLAPILPQIGEFVTAFVNFKFALLEAMAPIVKILGEKVLPILTAILNWAAESEPVMLGFLGALGAKWAYSGTQAAIAATKTVAAGVSMVASALATTATVIAQIALQGAKWAWLGIQAMLHAAKIAAAWLISMGPIALIIVAVVALVAFMVKNWDKIKEVITGAARAVLDWLKKNWPLVLAILTGPIGAIVIAIVKNWDKIWSITTKVFGAIGGFFGEVVGTIARTLGSIPGTVWDIIVKIAGFIGKLPRMVWDGLKKLGSILWDVVKGAFNLAVDAVKWGIDTIIWFLKWVPSMAWEAMKGLGDTIWDVIKGAINGVIGLINWFIKLWNDLKFPELSAGGSWGIPKVTIGGWNLPNIPLIPKLADGGIATRATLGIFGEAGPEAIMPLDRLEDFMAPMAAPGGAQVTLTLDFIGADTEIGRALRKMIRVEGGGNVQMAFGRG